MAEREIEKTSNERGRGGRGVGIKNSNVWQREK
jgi:hypothetical protein